MATDLRHLLFDFDFPTGKPRTGALLVSEPFLREAYFSHSVILLIEHDARANAMGIVLNKSTNYTIGQVIPGVDDDVDVPLFCGGPMSLDRLYFLHTLDALIPGGREVIPGLWIGGDFEAMTDYVNSRYPTEGRIRFFVGYSGWDPMQLEGELRKKVWTVAPPPAPPKLLTGDDDAYWHRIVHSLGPEYRGWMYHPENPRAN